MTKEILNGEMMNEEKLNAVVGGTRGELSCDTKFLYSLGLMPNSHEPGYCANHADDVIREIIDAVMKTNSLSVMIHFSANGKNKYNLTTSLPDGGWANQDVTRAYFYRRVCEAVGKPDFDYEKYM